MASPSDHARLSASGSKRWLECPPSLLLEEQFPDRTSAFAEEGQSAHAYAERILLEGLEMPGDPEYDVAAYVDYVRALKGDLHIEARLDLSAYVPDGFGTGDAVVFHDDGLLEIVDLKYGKGVVVDPDHNTQLMLYGLGAYWTFEPVYEVNRVKTTIIQPRLNAIGSAEYEVSELLAWAKDYVAPRAAMALLGEGQYNPGEHCQFCRAKGLCTARMDFAQVQIDELQYDKQLKPSLMSTEQIAKVLQQADEIIDWLKDVQDYALEAAEAGQKIPGYKLVEGRANRKVADELGLVTAAKGLGYEEALLYERKLLGVTALEKLFGKKLMAKFPEGIIVKPQGKPALVPESDKRPEINSASADFAHLTEEV